MKNILNLISLVLVSYNSSSKLTYQLTFSLIGTPTGDEIVSINPILNPRSVYNCGGEFGIIQSNNLNKVRRFMGLNYYIK